MSLRRRDFLMRASQVGAGVLAFPAAASAASADTAETLERRLRRILSDVAPLRSFRLDRIDDSTWEVGVGWEPYGEFIGQVPVADESTITVFSFVLPPEFKNTGAPLRMYRAWGGRVKAAFPTREYSFLAG
jgi:hypothetical protein